MSTSKRLFSSSRILTLVALGAGLVGCAGDAATSDSDCSGDKCDENKQQEEVVNTQLPDSTDPKVWEEFFLQLPDAEPGAFNGLWETEGTWVLSAPTYSGGLFHPRYSSELCLQGDAGHVTFFKRQEAFFDYAIEKVAMGGSMELLFPDMETPDDPDYTGPNLTSKGLHMECKIRERGEMICMETYEGVKYFSILLDYPERANCVPGGEAPAE
jgi:hypothetical protein